VPSLPDLSAREVQRAFERLGWTVQEFLAACR
jgi:predicted RNA binding protein YcfA (HicA-like mRNA interferase family)